MSSGPVRTVTFDYWNTLLSAQEAITLERRTEEWATTLAEAGHLVTADALAGAFTGTWESFRAAWQANRQFVAGDAVDRMLELLELQVEADLRRRLIEGYTTRAATTVPTPAPNVGETLAALKAAGLRVGIICDVGLTPSTALRANLERLGLLGHFDHVSFSDEVGVYKPDPAIFAHALEGLGGEPETSVHIGDLRRTDVAGARAAGWTSVRYTGLHDDDGTEDRISHVEADHVVTDHAELPRLLGLP